MTDRVKGEAVERLEELFSTDIFIAEDRAWRTAQISLTDDARGYRFQLGFGTDCVCIAPENVSKNIIPSLASLI